MTDYGNKRVHIWHQSDSNVTKTTIKTIFTPDSLHVNSEGDIFVGSSEGSVSKWRSDTIESVAVMKFSKGCLGLFIDIDNSLYCSLGGEHRVVKQSLYVNASISTTVAGTGRIGSAANTLNHPHGILVDINFDLYIADCNNDRVQLFKFGQSNGITVAGNSLTSSVALTCPTGVFLAGKSQLFIVDRDNHRIIRSSFNGFDCVIGCLGVSGAASSQLRYPSVAAFDHFGNIFTTNLDSNQILKFHLITNTLGKRLERKWYLDELI